MPWSNTFFVCLLLELFWPVIVPTASSMYSFIWPARLPHGHGRSHPWCQAWPCWHVFAYVIFLQEIRVWCSLPFPDWCPSRGLLPQWVVNLFQKYFATGVTYFERRRCACRSACSVACSDVDHPSTACTWFMEPHVVWLTYVFKTFDGWYVTYIVRLCNVSARLQRT